jgi:uncharacterized protein (DUF58 family)
MHLHPTRAAVDIAIVGIGVSATGVLSRQPAILAWGASLLVGLAIARAVTTLSIAKVRASGFEMLWRDSGRYRRIARGQTLQLEAEVRNRDARAASYVELRAVASPELDIEITPAAGEVPAGGRLLATVTVHARRVGRHGIHGLSLEVRGSPGLFEVPLTFSNPYGIEVLPAAYAALLKSARGGRSRASAEDGRPGPLPGDGLELREIREHQQGDAFKRIAWKASARRGKLLVREYEREERDVVWLLLDASVELWAGAAGTSPLDLAIDEVAAVAMAHLSHGDRVGLRIAAARPLAEVPPGKGPRHGALVLQALATSTATIDADRSDLDESDVAARVVEHLRPLDPKIAQGLSARDPDRLARKVRRLAERGPFSAMEIHAASPTDRILREHLARFGIGSPARQDPEGAATDLVLASLFEDCIHRRPRASIVYVWSPTPESAPHPAMARAISRRPRLGLEIRWIPMRFGPSLPRGNALEDAIADAVALRTQLDATAGERALRTLGVRVDRVRSRGGAPSAAAPSQPPAGVGRVP